MKRQSRWERIAWRFCTRSRLERSFTGHQTGRAADPRVAKHTSATLSDKDAGPETFDDDVGRAGGADHNRIAFTAVSTLLCRVRSKTVALRR